MPVIAQELVVAAAGGRTTDFYLHIQGANGKVKGEATAPGHEDDIVVTGWGWSINGGNAARTRQASGNASFSSLTIHKRIDRATTTLVSMLCSNTAIKEARLVLRRPTGDQEPYFTITLEKARVESMQHDTDEQGHPREVVVLAFEKVNGEYHPQQGDGIHGGSTEFNYEIGVAI